MRDLFVRMRDEADWPQSHWAHFQTIRLKRWSAGRVAVLGDAAHAMPPYLAQGAGHAMMNALGLAEALCARRATIEAGARAWERRERPLTEHTQLLDPHLRRDHVPAGAAEENFDSGGEDAVGRGAICARGEPRADRVRCIAVQRTASLRSPMSGYQYPDD